MMPLKNNRLIAALRREPVDATPIWIMRQAGRYLPEYRRVRVEAGDFMTLCKTPELACEVTLQPIQRFPLDAAILFSDILTIPDAMGLGLHFKEGEGPHFERPVRSEKAIAELQVPDPEEKLSYVLRTIQLIQQELAGKIPLIGFCGSPWTMAAYMVEGKGHSDFQLIQNMMRENPVVLHSLLEKLAQAVALHLNAQIKAGVNVVMIFDTWGGLLDTQNYQAFSLAYIKKIFSQLVLGVPRILFTKNGGQWLELIADSGCNAAGVDWTISLHDARIKVQNKIALQGNLNPDFLRGSDSDIEQEVIKILNAYGNYPGHIFNLGHGITPDILPEKVGFLVDAVHRLSRK